MWNASHAALTFHELMMFPLAPRQVSSFVICVWATAWLLDFPQSKSLQVGSASIERITTKFYTERWLPQNPYTNASAVTSTEDRVTVFVWHWLNLAKQVDLNGVRAASTNLMDHRISLSAYAW